MQDALSLLEATVWLWPELEGGGAILASPIWSSVRVQNLRADRVPIGVETRPTGSLAPRRRVLAYTHFIAVARPLITRDDAWPQQFPTGPMVMQCVWHPEGWAGQTRGTWISRTYFGVTVDSHGEADREGVDINTEIRFFASSVSERNGTGAVTFGV